MSIETDTEINEANEKLSAMMESANNDPHVYIMAFMVRNGILDQLDKAARFAASEKLTPGNYLEALITIMSIKSVTLFRTDIDMFDENLNTAIQMFGLIFGETLAKQTFLKEMRKSNKE